MDRVSSRKQKMTRKKANNVALEIEDTLSNVFDNVVICGSIRRKEKFVNDIDIAVAYNGSILPEHISALFPKSQIIRGGEETVTFLYKGIQVNCYRYKKGHAGAMLLYLTGPGAYNIWLRRKALYRKLKLNQYGLYKEGKCIASKTERDIYEALGEVYQSPRERRR